MKKNKVLILGSAGMAGHVIKRYLSEFRETYDVYDIARSESVNRRPSFILDVTDFKSLSSIIENVQPDFIINCVGLLNKTAEDNPDLAILINSYLPHLLEKITKNTKCKIIHISTDCVFSGLKGGYIESELKDGAGFYAQSKALGEIVNRKDLTIRTSIIGPEINSSGIGLLNWFLNQKNEISGYSSAFWSGVTTLELAKFIHYVLTSNSTLDGIFHLTNNTKIDKFSLLEILKSVFNKTELIIKANGNYKVDKSLISTKINIDYIVPNYSEMIHEMRDFMNQSGENYHYNFNWIKSV